MGFFAELAKGARAAKMVAEDKRVEKERAEIARIEAICRRRGIPFASSGSKGPKENAGG